MGFKETTPIIRTAIDEMNEILQRPAGRLDALYASRNKADLGLTYIAVRNGFNSYAALAVAAVGAAIMTLSPPVGTAIALTALASAADKRRRQNNALREAETLSDGLIQQMVSISIAHPEEVAESKTFIPRLGLKFNILNTKEGAFRKLAASVGKTPVMAR